MEAMGSGSVLPAPAEAEGFLGRGHERLDGGHDGDVVGEGAGPLAVAATDHV